MIKPLLNDLNIKGSVYGITSLTLEQADAKRLLELSRAHWSIENRSHYVRDMVYDQDRHQLRKNKGPQIIAFLRNFASYIGFITRKPMAIKKITAVSRH